MLVNTISISMLFFFLVIIVYHHIGYPLLLRHLASAKRTSSITSSFTSSITSSRPEGSVASFALPTVTLIVPVFNEASVIEQKIANIAAFDYPKGLLSIVIALDGCTDASHEIVQRAIARADLDFHIVEYPQNIGKIAVLNDRISAVSSDIIALTDASAVLDADSIRNAVRHFSDPLIGIVCAAYRLAAAGSEGERAYWSYQTQIKADESTLAAPMGAHGAFYMFRRRLWQPLPLDTINDDFILPMQIVLNGSRAIYDPSIIATELECTTLEQEFRRRVRIGAGNMQQTVRLARLAAPHRGRLAFLFLSGEGLRPIIPFLALAAMLSTVQLAWTRPHYIGLLIAALTAPIMIALSVSSYPALRLPKPVLWYTYFIHGHAASLVGSIRFLTGRHHKPWVAASVRPHASAENFIPARVAFAKRACDIILTMLALPLFLVLLIPIAIAIKLSSAGPIFYRQLRVGRATSSGVHSFELIKFRTMQNDAEAGVGPVWAAVNDPRVTAVGRSLRKTHLDELPQLINVLKGDMSLVGPRPERPSIAFALDLSIPFYADRTFGLPPGITGLAQVNIMYDSCLDDVCEKVMYDHVYAARLCTLRDWLLTDVAVLARTIFLVLTLQGR